MYWINCMGNVAPKETAEMLEEAYGIDPSEEKHIAKGKPITILQMLKIGILNGTWHV